jgi:hypothetical protein
MIKDEIGRAYSKDRGEECIYQIGGKARRKRDH